VTETLRDFVGRRKRELLAELEPLERMVAAIRDELSDLERTETSILVRDYQAWVDSGAPTQLPAGVLIPNPDGPLNFCPNGFLTSAAPAPTEPTIKEMVLGVLTEVKDLQRFGATLSEIREHIFVRFDRKIELTSLSPQLSRLREDDKVELKDGRWKRKRHLRDFYKMGDSGSPED
jgi:hypothetical protein